MASIKDKDYTPIIMWASLVAGIIILGYTREGRAMDIWSGYHMNLDRVFIIVDSGPYRYTRHPAYAGMILAHIGVCLYYFNWVTISVFLLIFMPALLFRIAVEEKILFEIEGYAEFSRDRKRLFTAFC